MLQFSIAEQMLADLLKLEGHDGERAGAMIVGRLRDGSPLVFKETDGLIPAKANKFRYDGLDATGKANASSVDDSRGLRCPFQAHITKTNPRQNTGAGETKDFKRRIVRTGIPFGTRKRRPTTLTA